MKQLTIKRPHAPEGGAGEPNDLAEMNPVHVLDKAAAVRLSARGKPFSVEHRRRRAIIARHAEAGR